MTCGCAGAAPAGPVVLGGTDDEPLIDGALVGRRCGGARDCAPEGPTLQPSELFAEGGARELRFEVRNETAEPDWVLEIYGQLDRIALVEPGPAGEATGHFVPLEQRRLPAVRYALPLRLAPGETTEVILHAHLVPHEPLRASLLAEAPFRRRTLWRTSLVGFALGGMLFLAIQALFIFLWTQDRSYLWYGLYAFAGFGLWSVHFGYAALVVVDGEVRHQLVAVLMKVMVLCIGLFTMGFLDLWKTRGERRPEALFAKVIGAAVLVVLPLDLIAGRSLVKPVSAAVIVLGMCFVIAATVLALVRGERRARFLVIGWFPVLLAAVVGIGTMFFAERPLITRESMLVLHVWELAFAAFAFADRMRLLQAERDHAAVEAERQRSAARTDALTGLENRTAFDAYVESIESAEGGDEKDRTLVVFDVDGLKEVNDTLGHAVGDEMLQTLAREVVDKLRKGDRLFRIGGDEFVLAIEAGDPAGPLMIKRLEAVVDEVRAQGFERFGLSAGHCSIAAAQGRVREAFRIADSRMYEAKGLRRAGSRVSSFPAPRPAS